jgi:cyclopropane fatty-acyl-phospholipid synthase-like methyltransferase
MTENSKGGTVQALIEKFPWHTYKTFLDVGSSEGAYSVEIARAHKHLTGTGFDLPPVQPLFEEYIRSFNLHDRLHFASGDFFKDSLPKADVIIMAHILHDWNLEEKQALLRKAYASLPTDGALILCDLIIDDDRRENTLGLLMSLNMLIETSGGFDYTGADGIAWLKAAGFRHAYVEHLVGPDSIVVGIK